MSGSTDSNQVALGDEVVGSDGAKVGTVAEVSPGTIVVEKGFFFPTDYFIPVSAIASVTNGQIVLTVSREEALHSGWDSVPETHPTATGSVDTMTDAGLAIANPVDDQLIGVAEIAADEEIRIPVIEEELTATVRPTEAGAVRIEKRVITEDRVIDVPVTDEQIRVERRIVDRPLDAGGAEAFEQIIIEVPLRSESVDVQKQARVTEEIVISKETVQRTERVTGTVRREEVIIDEDAVTDPATVIHGADEGSRRPT